MASASNVDQQESGAKEKSCFFPSCTADKLQSLFKRCSRCRKSGTAVYYCSRECQQKHWKDHKGVCGLPPNSEAKGKRLNETGIAAPESLHTLGEAKRPTSSDTNTECGARWELHYWMEGLAGIESIRILLFATTQGVTEHKAPSYSSGKGEALLHQKRQSKQVVSMDQLLPDSLSSSAGLSSSLRCFPLLGFPGISVESPTTLWWDPAAAVAAACGGKDHEGSVKAGEGPLANIVKKKTATHGAKNQRLLVNITSAAAHFAVGEDGNDGESDDYREAMEASKGVVTVHTDHLAISVPLCGSPALLGSSEAQEQAGLRRMEARLWSTGASRVAVTTSVIKKSGGDGDPVSYGISKGHATGTLPTPQDVRSICCRACGASLWLDTHSEEKAEESGTQKEEEKRKERGKDKPLELQISLKSTEKPREARSVAEKLPTKKEEEDSTTTMPTGAGSTSTTLVPKDVRETRSVMRIASLPSPYWLELADEWTCGRCCAFAQFPKEEICARRGVVFVGTNHLLVPLDNVNADTKTSVRVTSLSPCARAKGKETRDNNEEKQTKKTKEQIKCLEGITLGQTDTRWMPLYCPRDACGAVIGVAEDFSPAHLLASGHASRQSLHKKHYHNCDSHDKHPRDKGESKCVHTSDEAKPSEGGDKQDIDEQTVTNTDKNTADQQQQPKANVVPISQRERCTSARLFFHKVHCKYTASSERAIDTGSVDKGKAEKRPRCPFLKDTLETFVANTLAEHIASHTTHHYVVKSFQTGRVKLLLSVMTMDNTVASSMENYTWNSAQEGIKFDDEVRTTGFKRVAKLRYIDACSKQARARSMCKRWLEKGCDLELLTLWDNEIKQIAGLLALRNTQLPPSQRSFEGMDASYLHLN